jgi:Fe-S cluster biogenesis protein NfuA
VVNSCRSTYTTLALKIEEKLKAELQEHQEQMTLEDFDDTVVERLNDLLHQRVRCLSNT